MLKGTTDKLKLVAVAVIVLIVVVVVLQNAQASQRLSALSRAGNNHRR